MLPAGIAEELADEATEMTAYEDFVTGEVRAGRSILGLYPATDPQALRILPNGGTHGALITPFMVA